MPPPVHRWRGSARDWFRVGKVASVQPELARGEVWLRRPRRQQPFYVVWLSSFPASDGVACDLVQQTAAGVRLDSHARQRTRLLRHGRFVETHNTLTVFVDRATLAVAVHLDPYTVVHGRLLAKFQRVFID